MDLATVLESLRRAVAREPDDDALRAHLATLLVQAGLTDEAVAHVGLLLARDPGNADLQALMRAAMAPAAGPPAAPPAGADGEAAGSDPTAFDWGAAEQDLIGGLAHEPVETRVRMSDVGGLAEAKEQIDLAFLTPLRNPELRARYGASLRGGLLLYGPPGCGKTHLARAVAGELGARFIPVALADVLSRWVGQSENNIAELFRYARAQAPCVLFFDELDALGHARSSLGRGAGALRGVINQLLTELDGIGSDNEGVFVLGATNAPWDVDLALRRPGRLDRSVFVPPPDLAAREQILRTHLAPLPVQPGLDVADLARRTERFSGADLAHAARTAAQRALADAVRTGAADRPVTAEDLRVAISGITPSTGRWFEAARNVVLFADGAGEYQPLAAHMRAHGLL